MTFEKYPAWSGSKMKLAVGGVTDAGKGWRLGTHFWVPCPSQRVQICSRGASGFLSMVCIPCPTQGSKQLFLSMYIYHLQGVVSHYPKWSGKCGQGGHRWTRRTRVDGGTENNDRTLFRTPIKITNKPYVLKQNFHNENYRHYICRQN